MTAQKTSKKPSGEKQSPRKDAHPVVPSQREQDPNAHQLDEGNDVQTDERPVRIVDVEPILEVKPNTTFPIRALVLVLAASCVAAGVGAGILVYPSFMYPADDQPLALPTIPSAVPPTATPIPPFQPGDIAFEILNGSGRSGKAGDAAETVRALGFPVVRVANADRSDYETTSLIISESIASISAELQESLEKEFTIATTSTNLKSTTASARLIIGKE